MTIMNNLQDNFTKYGVEIKAGERIALAVSGGADSMYLTLQCIKNGIDLSNITVLTVDHGLRTESAAEAQWVKEQLQKYGLKVHILEWHGQKPSANVQAAAREARYKLLCNYCIEHSIKYLLVGHHMDDQAETMVLRMLRGSGLDGMCGIYAETELYYRQADITDCVKVIRPLLHVKKSEIIVALQQEGWQWIEDPSNNSEKYERNKVRKLLQGIDKYSQAIERMTLLAENLQRSTSFIDAELKRYCQESCVVHPLGFISLDKSKYVKMHIEIKLRLVRLLLQKVSGNRIAPRLERLEKLALALQQENNTHKTLHGCEIITQNNVIYFMRELAAIPLYTHIAANATIVWDGRFVITTKQPLVITPLGFKSFVQLHKKLQLPKLVSNKIYQGLPSYEYQGQKHALLLNGESYNEQVLVRLLIQI